jgi:hypothetical protein
MFRYDAPDLKSATELLVPARIFELVERGGATFEDIQRVVAYAHEMATREDLLIVAQSKEEKEAATDLLNKIVDAIAVLSFLPGGFTFMGTNWEAERLLTNSSRPITL